MDELASQWYQVGSLFIQIGFLIVAVWSVRTIAKSIRASEEQMGALLRLTLSGVRSEDNAGTNVRPIPDPFDGWPEATHATIHVAMEKNEKEGRRSMFAGLIGWLREPMATSGIGQWRRLVRWLQAPAGN
jgi:hypothetical protein